MTDILGPNLVLLGHFGIIYAFLGVLFLASILPRQIREATVKDGIRKVRIALPIINVVLMFVFSYAVWTAFDKVVLQGIQGTVEANLYRFVIGSGLGIVGTMFLIIYRFGGSLFTEDHI